MEFQVQEIDKYFEEFRKLLSEPIFHIKDSAISLTSLFMSALVIFVTIIFAKYASRGLNRVLDQRGLDSGVRDSLTKFAKYIVIAMGTMFALDNLGVSITSLAAVGALLMVGIGFGLQNITQNFISGVIILIERPIKVGDIIRVGSSSGRVVDIRVRSSIIQTRDDVSIIIPNSRILSEDVISDSFSGQKIRQKIPVGVAYGSDVEMVKNLLSQAALEHADVLQDPGPKAIFKDFGESALDFELRYWTEDIWHTEQISSDIRCTIERTFREAKIQIPYPTRELHIKNPQASPRGES